MLAFQVIDMTCGHCAGLINKAIKAMDDESKVTVDLQRRLVSVASIRSTSEDIRDAIAEAGYTPIPCEA